MSSQYWLLFLSGDTLLICCWWKANLRSWIFFKGCDWSAENVCRVATKFIKSVRCHLKVAEIIYCSRLLGGQTIVVNSHRTFTTSTRSVLRKHLCQCLYMHFKIKKMKLISMGSIFINTGTTLQWLVGELQRRTLNAHWRRRNWTAGTRFAV